MMSGEEKESILPDRLRQSTEFATDHNTNAYKFYIPESRKVMVCGQAKFDELYFPFSKQEIIDQDKEDHLTNILSRVSPGSKWVHYDKSLSSNLYE